MRRFFSCASLRVILVLFVAFPATDVLGQEIPNSEIISSRSGSSIVDTSAEKSISPDVIRCLDGVQRYLQSLESYSFRLELGAETVVAGKVRRKPFATYSVNFKRPNKLLMKSDNITYVSDGETARFLGLSVSGKKMHLEKTAPADFRAIHQDDCFKFVAGHGAQLLSSMFHTETMKKVVLANCDKAGFKFGHDSDCVVTLLRSNVQQRVYFSNQPKIPIELRVTRTRSTNVTELFSLPKSLIATISDWVVNPQFNESGFTLQIPPESQRIQSLVELIDVKRPKGPDPLFGKPAPNFSVAQLDGTLVKLESHLGQRVVVLDFWATWSQAFYRFLPILENVRKEAEGSDVVFLSVNVREDLEIVDEFLKKSKRKLGTVVLDSDGDIANMYAITGIPQTFVIGKDGRVSAVFRGFSTDLERRFKDELKKQTDAVTRE